MEGKKLDVNCSPGTFRNISLDSEYRARVVEEVSGCENYDEIVFTQNTPDDAEQPAAQHPIDVSELSGLGNELTDSRKVLWLDAATKLLISKVKELRPKVGKSTSLKTKKHMWTKISEELCSNGHFVTASQAEAKFFSLERQYKKTQLHNSRTGRNRKTCTHQDGGLSNFLYYVSLPEDGFDKGLATNATSHEVVGLSDPCEPRAVVCNDGDLTDFSAKSLRIYDGEPRDVLLRIYGQAHGEDALEAVIAESVVFALLSERNFGPKLYGIFPGGRIEQYIPARPLITKELSYENISMKIAKKMGEIHSLNIPMSKEPDWVWNCMNRWLTSMNNILQDSNINNSNILIPEVRNFDYSMEITWLKASIDQGNYAVLFCHNDLQEGNILLREDIALDKAGKTSEKGFNCLKMDRLDTNTKCESMAVVFNPDNLDPDLRIIDFEYCAYNYRGFDLANHFLEWSFDYTNSSFPFFFYHKHQYPTARQRHNFIAAYLEQLHHSITGYEPTEQEIRSIEEEVKLFSMFSHLFWSLWSVVNVTSNIEFGYWEYACIRIQEYLLLKQDYNDKRNVIQSVPK